MQLSLVAVVHIVNALFGSSCASADDGKGQISNVFEAFGYSPACVASALTSCEFSSTKELSVDVVDSIEGTNLLLQEMKSERESSSSVLKFLLQEMKSEIGNSLSEIKAICQVIKSEEENSSSVVKTRLLQEWKSEISNTVSVIKSIRQELKSAIHQEMQSERKNSVSVLKSLLQEIKGDGENSSSVVKALLQEMKSEIKDIRQEMKFTEENSSSVVKSLLQEMKSEIKDIRQEMKSEIGNSVSEIKAVCQEMKSEEENSSSVVKTTVAPEGKELPKNCAELKMQGETSSGVQTVYPYGSLNPKQTTVYCNQATDGGGWTVIQSRSPLTIRENFTRNWDEYVEGFGDPKGEFWIGLDNIHALTNSGKMALRVDLEDAEGVKAWALYGTFHVGDAASKYVLSIGGYSGDAGDGMTDLNSHKNYNSNNMKFSTFDNDNDLWESNCAERLNGGWWFNACHGAHLNGLPIVGEVTNRDGIRWKPFRGYNYSMKKATMQIRPVSLGF